MQETRFLTLLQHCGDYSAQNTLVRCIDGMFTAAGCQESVISLNAGVMLV